MSDKVTFRVGDQFYTHSVRPDGTRSLSYGTQGDNENRNHAVIGPNGTPKYIRENGQQICNDRFRHS